MRFDRTRIPLLLSLLAPLLLQPAMVRAAGVEWANLSLDEALRQATEQDKMVMIEFWASHCGACGQMDIDIWETPDGEKLVGGIIPIKIDSTSPEGVAASARYPLTGLPATIYLLPDGSELGRVEGYTDRAQFLRDALLLHDGVDPLPMLEARLEADPGSLDALLAAMEHLLNLKREAEAESLFARIIDLDPKGHRRFAERAIRRIAKHYEYFRQDNKKAADYWVMMVEKYPGCSSIASGVDGVIKTWGQLGRRSEWTDWICGVLKENPGQQMLYRAVVYASLRGGFRAPCLGDAAREAAKLRPQQAAFMDSVAVILSGN